MISSQASIVITLLLLGVICEGRRLIMPCQMIPSVCQEDRNCMEEMAVRFPDCFVDDATIDEVVRGSRGGNAYFDMDKRAPGVRLMKMLLMKDRIPTGR